MLIWIAALAALTPTVIAEQKQDEPQPKNEITKVREARKDDKTVRQVTPDPKKSPAKHADNLSKNVNHEVNRESKDINHGTKQEVAKVRQARAEDHTVRQVTPDPKKSPAKHADNLSKNVNHEINRTSKHINRIFQGKKP
jgi:hypothetical protein